MSNEVMSPISANNSPRGKPHSSRKIGDNVSFLDHNNVEIEDEEGKGDVTSPRDSSTKSTARKEEEILMKSEIRYDMCFMFPTDPTTGAFSERSEDVMRKILPNIGKDNVHIYYSVDRGEIIVLIKLSTERARFYADIKDLHLMANETNLQERAKLGWDEDTAKKTPKIYPLKIDMNERLDITRYRPFQHIYLKYDIDDCYQDLYEKTNEATNTCFSEIIKLKILYRLLEEPVEAHGLNLKMGKLFQVPKNPDGSSNSNSQALPTLLAAFPLHNYKVLNALKEKMFSWECFLPWKQPYEDIKEYYGEKIGLYFIFLGHFSYWLAIPAVIGLAFEIGVAATTNPAYPAIPFFSLIICVWGVLFGEFWKRNEKFTALEWGTIGYESNEAYRGEFSDFEVLKLTGEEVLYFPYKKKNYLVSTSFLVIGLLCCCVVGTTAAIYVIRYQMALVNKQSNANAPVVASVLNMIQIQIFAFIFSFLSDFLTDRENHQTDTMYEDSMIAKNFLFSFINTYSSFFFLAYFAPYVTKPTYPGQPADDDLGMCGYPSCMTALAINLGIILASNIVIGNFTELFIPWLKNYLKERSELQKRVAGSVVSDAERDYFKIKYDFKSLLGDYLEMIILFGFMTMFISALPGAAFLVFFSLWVEIKCDAWKLMTLTQRPWPTGAEDIGTWQDVLDIVITAAVITNGAMIVFTMPVLDNFTPYDKFWIFIGFQWVLFTAQYLLRVLIPDEPLQVRLQVERNQYFNDKLIEREEDDRLEAVNMTGVNKDEWKPENEIKTKYV